VRTITLDAWLVIGVLFIMGASAVYIFGRKITLIRESKKGNDMFTRSFRSSEHLFSLIEKNEEFPGSPLYRVYRAGCEELALLIERKSEAFKEGKKLTDVIINTLRSAIEKSAINESRKLSAGMVIMNVSISGGPFLGLLGTVWGVMNTFASLAESGEASLTAIAPGVASALSCTLAGLLVAIPALFGSSYVTSQLKDVNADVNLFLDDFIRRLEEERGDAS
jgi:biopolymer transport protein ExbB